MSHLPAALTRLISPPSLTLVLAVAASCGGGGTDTPDASVDGVPADAPTDAAVVPVLRNPVDTPNLELARQAVALLGVGGTENCDMCHALSRNRLQDWELYTRFAVEFCFTDTPTNAVQAQEIIECLRPSPDKPFAPAAAGIYTTAAGLPWFEYVFRLAYGDGWQTEHADFVARVAMPRGGLPPFTQGQLDIVAEWFARGLPNLEDVVPADPPPPDCTEEITSEVGTHIAQMATSGWRAINRDDGLLMFGCAGATDARGCLTTYPSSAERTWAQGWAAAAPLSMIRILRTNAYASSFWTRSSADGRFVSHGGSSSGAGATVIDLLQDREIPADAWYDPGFFPDNSGFIIQGSNGMFCEQSLLTSSPQQITFSEPQCSAAPAVGLYQHLGAVRGGDYWTVHGQFANDDGGHGPTTEDPPADFDVSNQCRLTPLVHTGSAFTPKPTIQFSTPSEGDTVIAPSSKLLVSRIGTSSGRQNGYSLRRLIATPSGDTYSVQTPVIATYCARGGKPSFSYDERWMVYHHYVEADDWQSLGYASATDPEFVALRNGGAANLFLMDLGTGVSRRITTMSSGQYALFPHFRSDGWIYAIVRDTNRNVEDVIASDAALLFEQ